MKSVANKANEAANKTINNSESNKPNTKASSKQKESLNDHQSLKILQEVERLLDNNENLQAINLLRALKDNMQGVKNINLVLLTTINLGILYYQVGFLDEAYEEFANSISKLKDLSQKMQSARNKDAMRIKYEVLIGKLQLQICILYSEMGKHDAALEYAKHSSRTNYNLIYDILAKLYGNLNKLLIAKNYPKKEAIIELDEAKDIINSIAVLNHLISVTKDLKLAFLQKERITILEQQMQITKRFGSIPPKVDIQALYSLDEKADFLWIYKNKILDQIQLIPLEIDHFEDLSQQVSKNDIIEKIAFLAISLYCFSTQTRFIEKQKNCDSHDVLDSQHWLSRSLEIAYSFMPAEAPILNQILTVHDRFHGLDKQTIPEDEEVTGFFKVLKPLSKPKSVYNSKTPGCSPIMIRIQADKTELHAQSSSKTHRELSVPKNNIGLDQSQRTVDIIQMTKNNRIRNLSHGNKRIETSQIATQRFNSSRATIDNPVAINLNNRTSDASKKLGRIRDQRMRINLSDLNGKAIIGEDLFTRPKSLQKREEKQDLFRLTQRKKKPLPFRKNQVRKHSLGNTMTFLGLEMKGHKIEQAIEAGIIDKVHNQTQILESARIEGNVYINNNINLYISKNAEINPFAQTYIRGQISKHKNAAQKQKEKDLSRRQMFLNKRRANNFFEAQNE